MKIRELKKFIDNLAEQDLDLDIMVSDPNRSSIINGLDYCQIIETEEEKQFAYTERENCNFPIGFRFLNLG